MSTPEEELLEEESLKKEQVQEEFRMDTPVGAPLKVKFRMEVAKLREFTFKKKMVYIWDYYKFQLIVIALVLAIIGSIINSVFINPAPQTVLFISWNAGFVTDEVLTDLSDVMKERILDETKNETVDVVLNVTTGGDPTFNMASTQRLMAMLAAGTIDVFILDPQMFEEFSGNTVLSPLDSILAEIRETYPEVYERIEEKITYALYNTEENDANTTEQIMGIDLSGNPLVTGPGIYEKKIYFGVSSTGNNPENVVKALVAFFEY